MCPPDCSISSILQIITASCKHCLTTAENYSDSRTSNKYWSKKPGREDYQFRRCFLARRRSWCRKLSWWQMPTRGLSSRTRQSQRTKWNNASLSSNSSQRSSPTSVQTGTSMTHSSCSRQRCSRMLSTLRNWWSLRKRSIDCIDRMLSTLLSAKFI